MGGHHTRPHKCFLKHKGKMDQDLVTCMSVDVQWLFFPSVSLFKPIHSFICVCMCMFIYFFGEAALCQFAFQKYNVSVRRLSFKWKGVNLLENRRPQMAFCLQAKMIHCQKQMCNVWAVSMPAGSSLPSSKIQAMPVLCLSLCIWFHSRPFTRSHFGMMT